jgi:serine/threonine protein kinase
VKEQQGIKEQHTQKVELEKPKSKENRGRREEQWTVKAIKRPPQQEEADDSVSEAESFGLTEEEENTFGDRFPYGFEKVKLLGRGGFSLVWLGRHIKSGREFAIKQIITQNTHQTHIKEIWFGTMFFSLGGIPKPEFASFPGVKNLVRLYSYEINQTDTWIFY